MVAPSPQDLIAERVERLLVRYEQLQHTHALMAQQIATLTQERDSLRSRLQAARHRIDVLIERLPTAPAPPPPPEDKA
jgi:cell division protein ZapB